MKILFDHQIYATQTFGGISRYFTEIISHLPKEITPIVSIKFSNNKYLLDSKIASVEPIVDHRAEFLKGIEFKGKGRLFNLYKTLFPSKFSDTVALNRQHTIDLLKKQDFDVFHPTYYDDYFLDYIENKPFVLTIHDMVHELYPEFYYSKESIDFVKTKAKLANRANHIVAVSENTKKDIIEILEIPENKISVVYHGSSLKKQGNDEHNRDLDKRYILYVGDRAAEYKNFKFFIRAIASVLKENPDLKIICTGKPFDSKELFVFDSFGISDRMRCVFANDDELAILYQNAICFVYPSYCEGFGIPILEAFQNNCPVLLANTSCFPEVGADAAIYFEPKSIFSIKKQIRKLINNDEVRYKIIDNGKIRLNQFSWVKSAFETSKIYQSIC